MIQAARQRRRRRWVAVVAAFAVGAAAALLTTQPWRGSQVASHHEADSRAPIPESKIMGSGTLIAAGGAWELRVGPGYPGRLCFTYTTRGDDASGCRPIPRAALPRPFYVAGSSPGKLLVLGLVSGAVDHVIVRLPGGRVATSGQMIPEPLDPLSRDSFSLYAFDLRVSRSMLAQSTMVAYSVLGKVVGRRAL